MVDDQDVDKHITISSMCHEAAGKYTVDRKKSVRLTTSQDAARLRPYVLHWTVVVSKFIGAHLHLGAKFTCGPPRCEDVASG
jgi:hypothetical protein